MMKLFFTEAEDEPKSEDKSVTRSIYEYAFKRGNSEYQMYYVFDIDDMIVRNFSTNDYGVMLGTFTGNIDSGFSIHWMDGWNEKFKVLNNTKAVLIDNDGFECEYRATSVDEAESILRQYRTIRRHVWRCLFRRASLADFLIYLQ